MSPDYAKATAAFLPANEPTPDPAFLDGLQPANRKIAHGQKGDAVGAEFTPPLTPPSEVDGHDKELGGKKHGGGKGVHAVAPQESQGAKEAGSGLKQRKATSVKAGGDAQSNKETEGHPKKKEAPGAGFAQSIKGTVSEERYVPTDLDQRIAQPCGSSFPTFSSTSENSSASTDRPVRRR